MRQDLSIKSELTYMASLAKIDCSVDVPCLHPKAGITGGLPHLSSIPVSFGHLNSCLHNCKASTFPQIHLLSPESVNYYYNDLDFPLCLEIPTDQLEYSFFVKMSYFLITLIVKKICRVESSDIHICLAPHWPLIVHLLQWKRTTTGQYCWLNFTFNFYFTSFYLILSILYQLISVSIYMHAYAFIDNTHTYLCLYMMNYKTKSKYITKKNGDSNMATCNPTWYLQSKPDALSSVPQISVKSQVQ
jgi:hypothetical protein